MLDGTYHGNFGINALMLNRLYRHDTQYVQLQLKNNKGNQHKTVWITLVIKKNEIDQFMYMNVQYVYTSVHV